MQQHPSSSSAHDASHPTITTGQNTAVLSAALLRNILCVFALGLFIGSLIDISTSGDDLPIRASMGRILLSIGVAICGLLAHYKRETTAFALFSALYIVGLFNAAFIAGFGINSPALLIGLVPVLLAIGLFERRKALLYCMTILAGWLAIISVHI